VLVTVTIILCKKHCGELSSPARHAVRECRRKIFSLTTLHDDCVVSTPKARRRMEMERNTTVGSRRVEGEEWNGMVKKAPNPTDKHVGSRVRMRRMMLNMSQEKLGDALGLTFQQVQKYEKGTNRIGASRLQQIAHILQVPVEFFFEGGPSSETAGQFGEAPSPAYVSDFLSSSDGLALTKAFMRISNPKLRRRIVDLVEEIAGGSEK
jgi:transcriptional regulator with XRE-family HTH domain